MKNAVLFGLLFCFATLNLSEAFFHVHDHQETNDESDWDFSVSTDEADCFVCDVNLIDFSVLTTPSVKIDPMAVVEGKEAVYFLDASDHYDLDQLRGPPAIV